MQSLNQLMAANVLHVLPEAVWCIFGALLMLFQPFLKSRRALTAVAMIGAGGGTLVTFATQRGAAFSGVIQFDTFSLFFHWLVGLVAFLVILGSDSYLEREHLEPAEPLAWACSPPPRNC